jgi:RNA polymerase sigma-70 factor (ECF subfamily)
MTLASIVGECSREFRSRPERRPARFPPSARRSADPAAPVVTPAVVERPETLPHPAAGDFRAQLAGALPQLRAWANRLMVHGPDAADLVQETCRRALEAQAQFTTGEDLRPWLFRILQNLQLSHLRKAWRLLYVEDINVVASGPAAEPPRLWRSVSDEDVTQAIANLPPLYRHVYTMRAIQRMSYREISRRLRLGENTVGTRLNRARALLRRALGGEAEDETALP